MHILLRETSLNLLSARVKSVYTMDVALLTLEDFIRKERTEEEGIKPVTNAFPNWYLKAGRVTSDMHRFPTDVGEILTISDTAD